MRKMLYALTAIAVTAATLLLSGAVDRKMLRSVLGRMTSDDKAKPSVYQATEGYSPGLLKSRAEEDFNRYHYYISPDPEELLDSDPEIYFRQDHEYIDIDVPFDEERYWREHPIELENHPPGMDDLDQLLEQAYGDD